MTTPTTYSDIQSIISNFLRHDLNESEAIDFKRLTEELDKMYLSNMSNYNSILDKINDLFTDELIELFTRLKYHFAANNYTIKILLTFIKENLFLNTKINKDERKELKINLVEDDIIILVLILKINLQLVIKELILIKNKAN